jgi:UDP-glucose:(heptosyl)LPS alpha-1,3-glucosyltransferase
MRLGLIRLKYDQSGGAERTLGMLSRGLLDRGHEVWVLTSAWQGPIPEGLQLEMVPLPTGSRGGRLAAWARDARLAMAGLGLDTCLSLERVPGVPVFRAGDGCHAAWLEHRAPYESFFKRLSFDFNPFHKKLLELERRTLTAPGLRFVVAGSQMVARELRHFYGLPQEKLRVITNGVDEKNLAPALRPETRESSRRELGLEPGQPVLLFLGSGWERKGLAFALRALAKLSGTVLLVAGRDRQASWQKRARKLEVEARVRFLGLRGDVAALLAASDAMVLPTIYDPCSNACLEALYAGVPVVTTSANGAAEFIRPGLNGVVLDNPADDDALAQAMESALSLPRGADHEVPGQDQWLKQTVSLLEESAGAA